MSAPKKELHTEPGLLPLFRILLLVQVALTALNVITHLRAQRLDGCPIRTVALSTLAAVLLLVYLSWPGLAHRMGRYHLPAAFVWVTGLALLTQYQLIHGYATLAEFNNSGSAWQVFLLLFSPLVLIGWQYNSRIVIAYCALTIGSDSLTLYLASDEHMYSDPGYQRMILIRAITFVVTGYVVSRIMTGLRRQRSELSEANLRLRGFAATVERLATSEERNRIARELHDTLAHTLSGMALQLEAARSLWDTDPESSRAMLDRSLTATRSGLAETRRCLHALRTPPPTERSLGQALGDLAAAARDRTGAAIHLDLADPPRLAPVVEHAICRIAQEALNNAVRHADAGTIGLKLEVDQNAITLTVADDGRGFDPAAVGSDRLGLRGLRERTELLRGRLVVDSSPGKGCAIRVAVPLDQRGKADGAGDGTAREDL